MDTVREIGESRWDLLPMHHKALHWYYHSPSMARYLLQAWIEHRKFLLDAKKESPYNQLAPSVVHYATKVVYGTWETAKGALPQNTPTHADK